MGLAVQIIEMKDRSLKNVVRKRSDDFLSAAVARGQPGREEGRASKQGGAKCPCRVLGVVGAARGTRRRKNEGGKKPEGC